MGRGSSSSTKVERVHPSDLEGNEFGRKHSFDPEFDGPMKNRSCTDIICLFLFILCTIAWVAVAVIAIGNGDPDRLIHPSDSRGLICGRGDLVNRPYLLFFDLTKCLTPSVLVSGCPTPQVCVESCPSDFGQPLGDFRNGNDQNEIREAMKPFCQPNATEDDSKTVEELVQEGLCPPWWAPSKPVLKRCLPSFEKIGARSIQEDDVVVVRADATMDRNMVDSNTFRKSVDKLVELLNLRSVGERLFSDLDRTWYLVLGGLVIGSVLAFVWILLMRFVAGPMVWLSLIGSTLLLFGCVVYCLLRYLETRDTDSDTSFFETIWTSQLGSFTEHSITWLVLLVITAILLLVVLIIICCLGNRIRLAIELIEEGSIAVSAMPLTLLFPVLPFLVNVGFVAFFVMVAVYLASMGEQKFRIHVPADSSCDIDDFECHPDQPLPDNLDCPNATCAFYAYGNDANAFYMQIYNLFMLLWSLFALSALEEMVLAGAFATWYFSLNKQRISSTALITAFNRTIAFHLGTIFFGSLIIAGIRLIRIMLDYIENKLKEYNAESNPLVKALLCCCQCCFTCLEKFMRFINRNAYVMTAIYGYSFISAAKEAFQLLMRNALRVLVLDQVADFLLLLGKLVVVGVIGFASFWVFSGRTPLVESEGLNYYFVPIIIIVLGTYMVADLFFDVYEMAVDTIFLCFLEDIERHDGSEQKPYYMSDDLKKVLGYHRDESNENTRANSPI